MRRQLYDPGLNASPDVLPNEVQLLYSRAFFVPRLQQAVAAEVESYWRNMYIDLFLALPDNEIGRVRLLRDFIKVGSGPMTLSLFLVIELSVYPLLFTCFTICHVSPTLCLLRGFYFLI